MPASFGHRSNNIFLHVDVCVNSGFSKLPIVGNVVEGLCYIQGDKVRMSRVGRIFDW